MIQLGVVLLLLGLLTGLAVPVLAVPRLGVSAHIVGVLSGLVLIVLGLLWPRLEIEAATSRLGYWLALYSTYVGWLMPLLGGMWTAGGATLPFAAGEARGTAFQEGVIATGLITSAAAVIALCLVLLWGLRGPAPSGASR
jgi:hydroxylaminobenzene mutase